MEITTKIGCRNACVYCPQDRLIRAYKKRSNILHMSFNVFKTCVDKIPLSVDIAFAGMGEPWLHSECTEMLLYAYKRGHKIIVFTTLVGMNLSDIDLLESVPFKGFLVHLPSKEGHEKIKIDENYLKVLNRVVKSNIKVIYCLYGENLRSELKGLLGDKIRRLGLTTRARNIKVKGIILPERKRGIMGCATNLRENILLPNGDVLLCCMDYEMKHIFGNLISSDYDSLFCSKEFMKVKKGLREESLDILCRYCDMWGYNKIDLFLRKAILKIKNRSTSHFPGKIQNL